jgi:hypothetical protein
MPTLSPWRKPSPILFLSLTLGLLDGASELAAAATIDSGAISYSGNGTLAISVVSFPVKNPCPPSADRKDFENHVSTLAVMALFYEGIS